jgi:hypothetical protein
VNGSNNTYLGRNAGFYNQNGSGNVFIGCGAGAYELGSNRLVIANTNTTDPIIYGEFDNSYLKFNANNTVTAGNFAAYGMVNSNDRFSVSGLQGKNDTVSYVTGMDFSNSLLKYKTLIYKGGILVFTSKESDWVSTVGAPFLPCGQISLIGEFSGWSVDQPLINNEYDPDIWTTTMYLSAGNDFMPTDGIVDMKFRENLSWDVNWGSSDFPTGIGIPDGPNIPVPLNPSYETTVYTVSFNCKTGAYTFTDISQ